MLIEHFTPLASFNRGRDGPRSRFRRTTSGASPGGCYDIPIEDLELTMRAYNCLKRAGITSVGDVLERLENGVNEMLAIRNFGQKSLDELLLRNAGKGLFAAGFSFWNRSGPRAAIAARHTELIREVR